MRIARTRHMSDKEIKHEDKRNLQMWDVIDEITFPLGKGRVDVWFVMDDKRLDF